MFWKWKKAITFEKWLDNILKNFNLEAVAFNFNIYENENGYSTELVATSSFDKDNDDWACDEIYASRNDNNEFKFTADNWENALALVQNNISNYLDNGNYSAKLKNVNAVACGFTDGDLTLILKNKI